MMNNFSEPLMRHSVKPLYHQIYEQLRQEIETGKLKPGDQIPAEMDLMRDYKVARITVRRAISELVNEGVLERLAGKGTFVGKPKIDRELVNVTSFTSRMEAVGLHASSKMVSKEVIEAIANLADELKVKIGSPILFLTRLRFSDGDPLALERVYMSLDRFPGLDDLNLDNTSLYSLLSEKYNIKPIRSKKTLEMVIANPEESRLLKLVISRSPLFLLRTTVYGEHFPIECAKILMRGDRFRFQI